MRLRRSLPRLLAGALLLAAPGAHAQGAPPELASHGYVVAAVEHPGDTGLVLLPGGRALHYRGWDADPERTPAQRALFHQLRHAVGAEDQGFVLTRLAELARGVRAAPGPRLRGRLDLGRAAAVGHSFGGMVSFESCARDPRWKTCVNLNGGLDTGSVYPPIHQQVLELDTGHPPTRRPNEPEEEFRRRAASGEAFVNTYIRAPLREVRSASTIVYLGTPGFTHFSFYDLPDASVEGLPAHLKPPAGGWARNTALIRRYLLAWLDLRLRGVPTPLFDPGHDTDEATVEPVGAGWHRQDAASPARATGTAGG